LVALPAHQQHWNVTLATLNAPDEVRAALAENSADLVTPSESWIAPSGGLSEMMAAAGKQATSKWRALLDDAEGKTLRAALEEADAVMISIGIGSLEALEVIPAEIPVHAFLIEMHRGVHDDVLHRRLDGSPKRPMWLTRLLLSRLKRWDMKWHARLWNRPRTVISSNTPTSIRLLAAAHGWPTLDHWEAGRYERRDGQGRPAGVGVLWHAVDTAAEPLSVSEDEQRAWDAFSDRPQGEYLLTIGRACYMKASLEALRIAHASGLPLVQVGGGEIAALSKHADSMGAKLLAMPRISGLEMMALTRNAVALIGIARGEGFGLTPLEAMMVGTPALVVDEAGFTHTITDTLNGRRLPWPEDAGSLQDWVDAVEQACDQSNRGKWSKAGRERILARWTPRHQAEAVARGFAALGVDVETSEETLLSGLDPA
jgi:glycosyltransferase involved in cell wall biosynthesis